MQPWPEMGWPVFLTLNVYGSGYSRMDQMKIFKGCLSQILLGPFFNTLTHMCSLDWCGRNRLNISGKDRGKYMQRSLIFSKISGLNWSWKHLTVRFATLQNKIFSKIMKGLQRWPFISFLETLQYFSTHFCYWSFPLPLENIRKAVVSWCFQRV